MCTPIRASLSYFSRGVLYRALERELSMRLFNAKVKSPVRDWDATVAVNPGTQSAAREELLSWAYTDPELHRTLAADLLLYNYGLALFRQQTRVTLGVQWT